MNALESDGDKLPCQLMENRMSFNHLKKIIYFIMNVPLKKSTTNASVSC